jgi:2-iminobutanoate/2-iminopropanoate deaminase
MDYVSTDQAPKAIGPYSQAVKSNGILYTSGQIALDPATGNLVEGDFAAQARRVFENLKAVLAAGGSDFSHVLRATVFLQDMGDFQTLNAIYAEYFGEHKPARTTIQAAGLPKGCRVEIDLMAEA